MWDSENLLNSLFAHSQSPWAIFLENDTDISEESGAGYLLIPCRWYRTACDIRFFFLWFIEALEKQMFILSTCFLKPNITQISAHSWVEKSLYEFWKVSHSLVHTDLWLSEKVASALSNKQKLWLKVTGFTDYSFLKKKMEVKTMGYRLWPVTPLL